MQKRKVLCIGEASFTASGFGSYSKELMERLYESGKYDLAELSAYGQVNDPRDRHIKWRYYANAVGPGDPREKEYNSKHIHQFGSWRISKVLLDFQPDIVLEFRDPFMFSFEYVHPLREFFHWIISPTVDSAPQHEDWLDMFQHADCVLTYSDFGLNTLKKELGNNSRIYKTAYPGANLSVFHPIENKNELKEIYGIPQHHNIVGTVMRNQRRKLYPDLFKSFRQFLEQADEETQRNTYLYAHTSYPDLGWKIPKLLLEFNVAHKTYVTYICRNCEHIFSAIFQDSKTSCIKCGAEAAFLPVVSHGISREKLAEIINLFDVYIQYANCEGLGFPQLEAAACGVPIMSVDYSAMCDVSKLLDGELIPVERMYRELELDADRAMPSNELFVQKLSDFFKLPLSMRRRKGQQTYQLVKKNFDWDENAKIWMEAIDKAELTGLQGQWDIPFRDFQPDFNVPNNLSNQQFVYWVTDNIMFFPQFKYSLAALNAIKQLDYGVSIEGAKVTPFTRNTFIQFAQNFIEGRISAEAIRTGKQQLLQEDFLEYAELKERIYNESVTNRSISPE